MDEEVARVVCCRAKPIAMEVVEPLYPALPRQAGGGVVAGVVVPSMAVR